MHRRRLPPLNSLRAFEAAARQLNFERAGDEIAVTASAVGQQVKALETWLGRPLFVRLPSKGVGLTSVGERYAAALTELLDRLDEATARALRAETSRALTVSTLASFAANWLIPRLGSLRERHPDLEVRVSVSSSRTDFAREDVDVAIRSGLGSYPGLRSDLLLEETFFPVCSAALLDDPTRPLREPSDLRHHTLVHEIVDVPDYITWDRWLTKLGCRVSTRPAVRASPIPSWCCRRLPRAKGLRWRPMSSSATTSRLAVSSGPFRTRCEDDTNTMSSVLRRRRTGRRSRRSGLGWPKLPPAAHTERGARSLTRCFVLRPNEI